MVEKYIEAMPFSVEDYIEYDDPTLKVDGDWGH